TRHLQHGEVDGAGAGLHYDGGRVVSTRSDGPPTGERIVRLRTFGWSRVLRDCAVAFRRCGSRQRDGGPTGFFALSPVKHRYGGRHIDDANTESTERRARAVHRAREQGASRLPTARRPLGIRARSRRDHSGRVCPAEALSWRTRRTGNRVEDRGLFTPD